MRRAVFLSRSVLSSVSTLYYNANIRGVHTSGTRYYKMYVRKKTLLHLWNGAITWKSNCIVKKKFRKRASDCCRNWWLVLFVCLHTLTFIHWFLCVLKDPLSLWGIIAELAHGQDTPRARAAVRRAWFCTRRHNVRTRLYLHVQNNVPPRPLPRRAGRPKAVCCFTMLFAQVYRHLLYS